MIRVIDVHRSFGQQQVLRGVNLRVKKGEILAIIGRSGSGKTVMLRVLIGLVRPNRGQVLIDDTDITQLSGRRLDRVRERFGMLFQGGALFDSMTVFDNVAFPLREKTHLSEPEIAAQVQKMLESVGLGEMGYKFPAELSGGMKKRTALARALITSPSIVLFDEPTTGLDPILVHAIHQLIKDTHDAFGYTAVIISHEIPEVFDIATRVAVIHDGEIIADDTPEMIRKSQDPFIQQFISGSLEGPVRPL
ncbi:MAG TPA: ABC transporter ATP-binding protein [Candidatus Tectomicrobia bacterium]|nr:ABC transporter ATP-binding protein [Candidatus Tectomicrobia bacterium]